MLFIASDHAGFNRKEVIKKFLTKKGISFTDLGTDSAQSVDFPVYAKKLCHEVLKDEHNKGILICGSGIGMSICANRFKGIRAGLCTSPKLTALARQHNNINVLVLRGRFGTNCCAKQSVNKFLTTPQLGDKYERRMNMIDK